MKIHCLLQETVAYDDPDKKVYHLCIVNLVIGLVNRNLLCFHHVSPHVFAKHLILCVIL